MRLIKHKFKMVADIMCDIFPDIDDDYVWGIMEFINTEEIYYRRWL